MNRAAQGVIAAAIGFCGAFVVVTASDLGSREQPDDPVVLGALDLMDYCHEVHGAGFTVALIANDAFGWRCVGRRNGVWGTDDVDFAAACQLQFGGRARPSSWDTGVADSWQCVSP